MKNYVKLILAGLLVLTLSFAFMSCDDESNNKNENECTSHSDSDGNGKCDNCGKTVENECTEHIDDDGDNLCDICDEQVLFEMSFTISVNDEDGNPVSGITVLLKNSADNTITAVTNAEGKATAEALPGSYTVNFEGSAAGCYIEGSGKKITLSEDENAFSFTLIDNNPDGSEEKPFFIGEAATEKTFAPGAVYYYSSKGAGKIITIENADCSLTYNGQTYLPESGRIQIQISEADSNSTVTFTVTNTSNSENKITVNSEQIPGSVDNPFSAQLDTTLSVTIPYESTQYYKFTASESGFLLLSSNTPTNNIMMYNITSYIATGYTDGGKSICLYVTEGDEISIAAASNSAEEVDTVEFSLSILSGSKSEPIPVYETTTLRLPAQSEVCFVYHGEAKTLSVASTDINVSLDGASLTAENGNYTCSVSEGSEIIITVTADKNTELKLTVS